MGRCRQRGRGGLAVVGEEVEEEEGLVVCAHTSRTLSAWKMCAVRMCGQTCETFSS